MKKCLHPVEQRGGFCKVYRQEHNAYLDDGVDDELKPGAERVFSASFILDTLFRIPFSVLLGAMIGLLLR